MTRRRRQTALPLVLLALAGCGGGGVSEVGQPNRAPAAVTLNVPANATETTLSLSWSQSADSDFAAYKLHRAPSSGVGQASTLVDMIATRTTLQTTATGLAASTTYFFRVYVCDAGGLCAGSNETSGTTTSTDNPWITIPAGEFVMGCADADTQCDSGKSPKHTVYLSAYKIQKYETTNAQYKQCVDSGACTAPSSSGSYTRSSYYGDAAYDDFPVICVDWFQSRVYCEWIGGRLPTEAEWEKAARGPYPSEDVYPWGDGYPTSSLANYDWNVGDTTEVGSYPDGASYYGAMDMAGNVGEWVNDWYDSSYYSASPSSDPQGPTTGSYRVLRGGTWSSYVAWYLRASFRLYGLPSSSGYGVGFRCAQDF